MMLTVVNCFRCLNTCLIKDPWKQNMKEHREYGYMSIPKSPSKQTAANMHAKPRHEFSCLNIHIILCFTTYFLLFVS